MAKVYTVTFIEHNAKIAGKYDGSILSTVSESGAKRKDGIFKNSKQFDVVKGLAKGDKVELKIVKNGDYYNLAKDDDAIKLVEKAGDEWKKEPSDVSTIPSSGIIQKPSYGFAKDPEVQNAIIRQNALTNSVNLVTAMLEKGMFPAKATSDVLVMEVTRIAREFTKYTSGSADIADLAQVAEVKTETKQSESDDEFGA